MTAHDRIPFCIIASTLHTTLPAPRREQDFFNYDIGTCLFFFGNVLFGLLCFFLLKFDTPRDIFAWTFGHLDIWILGIGYSTGYGIK